MNVNESAGLSSVTIAVTLVAVFALLSGTYLLYVNHGSSTSSFNEGSDATASSLSVVPASSTTTSLLTSSSAQSTSGTSTPVSGSTASTSTISPASGPSISSSASTSNVTITSTTTSSSQSQATTSCTTSSPALLPLALSNYTSVINAPLLFASYSAMSVSYSEISTGTAFYSSTYTQYDTAFNGTTGVQESYKVLFASPTTYKVEISESQGQSIVNATAWVLKSGTAVAYSYLGQNITGPEATGLYEGLMTPFFTESEYTLLVQTLTTANGVHASDQGMAKIGSATVALTNYTAATVPLTISICDGSITLSASSVQVGGVQGSALSVLTGLNVSGYETYDSQTNQISSLSFRLISLTVA
jgi:hypothetical protein